MIGSDTPRFGDRLGARWSALPPRRRRTLLAALVLALLAAFAGQYAASRPEPLPPPAPPWPFQSTQFRYLGLTSQPADPARDFAMRIAVTVIKGPQVRIERLAADFPQLKITAEPSLPTGFTAGRTRTLTLRMSVADCSGLPLDGGLPFINVTLSNERGREEQSWIPGGHYARDLSAGLHALCDQ
ncbi:hypothetical protein ACFQLX_00370 [Streptomyces polyrhachis]|uniref:Tat pathway signal sequence domain protein n=1 Tax=Streptomyces polyrhachis TaxID=1282885 RepID=A0ABW2GA72_9ACTN